MMTNKLQKLQFFSVDIITMRLVSIFGTRD